jgi:WD40 repeat protein
VINAIAGTVVDGVPVAVTVGDDGAVRTWDLSMNRPIATAHNHDGVVTGVACAVLDAVPVAVTAADDGVVRVWNLRTHQLVSTFKGHTGVINAVACPPQSGGPVAATVCDDYTLRVWDLGTGTETLRWAMPYPARAVAGTSGGELVAGIGHEVVVLQPNGCGTAGLTV